MSYKSLRESRLRRHRRIRVKIRGSVSRPRLCIFRSNKQIYVQLIDDEAGRTMLSLSSKSGKLADKVVGKKGVEKAKIVGETVAEMAVERGIKQVVFDRGGFTYGGRVKALAEGARAKGLGF